MPSSDIVSDTFDTRHPPTHLDLTDASDVIVSRWAASGHAGARSELFGRMAKQHGKRFNPHHDKLGKFATAGGYQSGVWKYAGPATLEAETIASFEREAGRALTADEKQQVLELIGPSSIHAEMRNGGFKITDCTTHGMPQGELENLAKTIDVLQTTNPVDLTKGNVHISVNSAITFPTVEDGYTGGETMHGTNRVRLNELIYERRPGLNTMPAEQLAGPALSTMVHEWGHMIDTRAPGEDGLFWISHLVELSNYGMTNDHEGYAEAFAEFFLSQGKTSNAAAQDYGRKYNWGTP